MVYFSLHYKLLDEFLTVIESQRRRKIMKESERCGPDERESERDRKVTRSHARPINAL